MGEIHREASENNNNCVGNFYILIQANYTGEFAYLNAIRRNGHFLKQNYYLTLSLASRR